MKHSSNGNGQFSYKSNTANDRFFWTYETLYSKYEAAVGRKAGDSREPFGLKYEAQSDASRQNMLLFVNKTGQRSHNLTLLSVAYCTWQTRCGELCVFSQSKRWNRTLEGALGTFKSKSRKSQSKHRKSPMSKKREMKSLFRL